MSSPDIDRDSQAGNEHEYDEELEAWITADEARKQNNSRVLDLRKERQREFFKPKQCGLSNKNKENMNAASLPRSTLMAIRPSSKIDKIREIFRKPKDCVPPTGFQYWIKLPLTSKIPYLAGPSDQMIYSLGSVGNGLIRSVPTFTLHNERVIKNKYNALHDPHAKEYFSSPHVRCHLKKQGLVSKYGEVLCSVGELNKFREYLLEINNSQINDMLERQEKCKKFHDEQFKPLMKNVSQEASGGRSNTLQSLHYVNRGTIFKLGEQMKKLQEFQRRQSSDTYSREMWIEKQERIQLARIQRGVERDVKIQRIRAHIRDAEINRQKTYLLETVSKAVHVHLREENAEFLSERDADMFDLEWLTAKMEVSLAKCNEEKAIQASMEADRHNKVLCRQQRVENQRKNLPLLIQRKKNAEIRLWKIVRKYFNIWLNKTRQNKAERERMGPEHTSAFVGRKGKHDPAKQAFIDLQQLKAIKLEDFVMDIMSMRSKARAEIAAYDEIDARTEKRRGFSISKSRDLMLPDDKVIQHLDVITEEEEVE